jgi:hypothetical protein
MALSVRVGNSIRELAQDTTAPLCSNRVFFRQRVEKRHSIRNPQNHPAVDEKPNQEDERRKNPPDLPMSG